MAGALEPVRTRLASALDKALQLNRGMVDAYLAPDLFLLPEPG